MENVSLFDTKIYNQYIIVIYNRQANVVNTFLIYMHVTIYL